MLPEDNECVCACVCVCVWGGVDVKIGKVDGVRGAAQTTKTKSNIIDTMVLHSCQFFGTTIVFEVCPCVDECALSTYWYLW